jgi:acyl carrier protein phosphodiesterase
MNWLAHALLSPPDPEVRLGNFLADLVKGRDRDAMSPAFRRGLLLHQSIDRFTDAHPIVHRSIARLGGSYRLAGGVIIDIFYDHFLALDWGRYHPRPLEEFTRAIYDDLAAYAARLSGDAADAAEWLIREDRLTSYRGVAGIEVALTSVSRRIAERTGRELHLERALTELEACRADLAGDFAAFFPELTAHAVAAAG